MTNQEPNYADIIVLSRFQEACRNKSKYPFFIIDPIGIQDYNAVIVNAETLETEKSIIENKESHTQNILELLQKCADYEKVRCVFFTTVQSVLQIVFMVMIILFVISLI